MATKRGAHLSASWVASGDLSALQYRGVVAGPSGNQVYSPGSGGGIGSPVGVLQNKPGDKQHAHVIYGGFTKFVTAQSVGIGAEIGMGTTGGGVVVTSGGWCLGYIVGAASSGGIAEMFVNIYRKGP
jgi:hypothetical protein